MELPYDINKWFSPRYAINYLWRLQRQLTDRELKKSKYKKEHEAWILGVALFGVMKMYGTKWWLQVPVDDPPDMKAMTIVPDEKKNINEMHHREVEIMQITRYTNENIVNEILIKLKNKAYIKETGLVVYLNRQTHIKDMRELSADLKSAGVKVADIWVIAATSPNEQEYILFSLYPDVQAVSYNIIDEMKNLEIGDTIDMEFSKGIKMELIRGAQVTKFIPH